MTYHMISDLFWACHVIQFSGYDIGCSNTTWCPLEEFEHPMSYNVITDSQWEEECSAEQPEDDNISCKCTHWWQANVKIILLKGLYILITSKHEDYLT